MEFEFSNRLFVLPNAKRMLVAVSGIRIMDKSGNTILESPKKDIQFDRSLTDADRHLLSDLKIAQ
jgi:hypothetical protein